MPATELLLRPAEPDDVPRLAAVHLAARAAAPMPPPVGTPAGLAAFLAERLAQDETWVAVAGEEVVGYARFTATWLDDLYVHPAWSGRGVGTALLELVTSLRPSGFGLWVFESNTPARDFYARRGLVERERTDGSQNAERAPDVRLEWAP